MVGNELKIWAAGAFDGEGSALIGVNSNSRARPSNYQVTVAVVNTDRRFTVPFEEAWGGNLITKPSVAYSKDGSPRREAYQLSFSAEEAQVFLVDILPYLKVKRETVTLVLKALGARRRKENLESYYLEGVSRGLWKMSKNYIPLAS